MSGECAIQSLKKAFEANVIGLDINNPKHLFNTSLVDVFLQSPRADSPHYIQFLNQACLDHAVDLVIPLTDLEVDRINKARHKFTMQTDLLIPSPELIKTARDKGLLSLFAKSLTNCYHIESIDLENIESSDFNKFIAKPTDGRSSEGLFYFSKDEAHLVTIPTDRNYVIQPFIDGEIITVDVIRDKFGNFQAVPRIEKIRTSNGAGLVVEMLITNINDTIREIVEKLDLIGVINIEFIRNGGNLYLMDINPRFSAGIGFSAMAGYDIAYNAVLAAQGQKIERLQATIPVATYAKKYSDIKL